MLRKISLKFFIFLSLFQLFPGFEKSNDYIRPGWFFFKIQTYSQKYFPREIDPRIFPVNSARVIYAQQIIAHHKIVPNSIEAGYLVLLITCTILIIQVKNHSLSVFD